VVVGVAAVGVAAGVGGVAAVGVAAPGVGVLTGWPPFSTVVGDESPALWIDGAGV
jgi:hypothetical protein